MFRRGLRADGGKENLERFKQETNPSPSIICILSESRVCASLLCIVVSLVLRCFNLVACLSMLRVSFTSAIGAASLRASDNSTFVQLYILTAFEPAKQPIRPEHVVPPFSFTDRFQSDKRTELLAGHFNRTDRSLTSCDATTTLRLAHRSYNSYGATIALCFPQAMSILIFANETNERPKPYSLTCPVNEFHGFTDTFALAVAVALVLPVCHS